MKNLDLFANDLVCPVSYERIVVYLQILAPAFNFNLHMQKTTTSIGEVVPWLIRIIEIWSLFDVDEEMEVLCDDLIEVYY